MNAKKAKQLRHRALKASVGEPDKLSGNPLRYSTGSYKRLYRDLKHGKYPYTT